ncbi:unnamed protein product [Schistosoma curassoni]|uniref:Uncharacterized protein n=1 Tax=Schistosoma curassoni TaxID=6186 RepID=A0A183L259_9TREM|nr:unnamed protein product [Schistosoma curassoni]
MGIDNTEKAEAFPDYLSKVSSTSDEERLTVNRDLGTLTFGPIFIVKETVFRLLRYLKLGKSSSVNDSHARIIIFLSDLINESMSFRSRSCGKR